MAKSYYKTIHGVRYDRALLEAVDERILGQGEGRISKKDAEKIVKLTKDGGRITETELNTQVHQGELQLHTKGCGVVYRKTPCH